MELWIRSQDRTKLVKADNISYMDTAEDYERKVHSLWNDCKGILGIYKTKERALEVLDEIQEILKPRTIIKFEKRPRYLEDGTISDVLAPKECLDYNKQLINYVYEMPEE